MTPEERAVERLRRLVSGHHPDCGCDTHATLRAHDTLRADLDAAKAENATLHRACDKWMAIAEAHESNALKWHDEALAARSALSEVQADVEMHCERVMARYAAALSAGGTNEGTAE